MVAVERTDLGLLESPGEREQYHALAIEEECESVCPRPYPPFSILKS